MAVDTYTVLFAAPGVVPADGGLTSSARFGHSIVVVKIYTTALIRETILPIGSS